ncbi:MAG: protein kinase [Leptolyngbya sp. BL-A-14]
MIGQLLTGRYLILEKLGGGGFSETYLARDKYLPHHPLCVVKSLQLSASCSLSPETAQQLFETEAKLLEQLGQHHNQIPTLLAYSHEHEQVYLIQEYIEGESLRKWLNRNQRLTTESTVKLLSEMLSILTYLHSHRIAHCDIKPSNIIRRKRDGKLVLIDFGAACTVPEATSSATTSSISNELQMAIGTPDYMPDEQKLGYPQLNSDLFALGILFIQLLTGIQPRQFKRDLISGQLDWQSHLTVPTIDSRLAVVLDRMVQSNFRDRYQTAEEVLADLQALPIKKRFGQRRGGWQGATPKVLLPALAGILLGVVGVQYGRTQGLHTEVWLNRLEQHFQPSDVQLTMMHDVSVQSGIDRMVIAPNNRILVTAGPDHTLRLWSLPTGAMISTLPKQAAAITALNISQNSKLLVSGREDGTVSLWDLTTGQFLRSFEGHRRPVTAVAISPDGSTVASGCQEGKIRRWDLQTGVRLQTIQLLHGGVTALTYGTTSDRLISASNDSDRADTSVRQIQIWDLSSGKLARTFAGHTAAISGLQVADDHMLFSVGKDRGLMWDLKREELATVFPQDSANTIAASFNEQNIVTVHANGGLRIWMRKAGRLVQRESSALGRNLDVALSPNHRYLVSWGTDQRLRVWQLNANDIH